MSTLIFTNHSIVVEGETFTSKIWRPEKAKRTIAIVPPGGVNIDWNVTLLDNAHSLAMREFLDTSNIIIFDYPGIGKAPAAKHATIQELAVRFNATLDDLGFQKVILVGISFGGCVANEMIDRRPELFIKTVIAASGEFLLFPIKQIFIGIVTINLLFPFTSSFIKYLLVDVVKFFDPFDLNDAHSLVIMGRSIFKYTIGRQKHLVPTHLVFLENDQVVRQDSVTKILAKYPNHSVTKLSIRHTRGLFDQEKLVIEQTVFKKVIPFLIEPL